MAVAVADATGVVPNSSAGYPIATGQATQAPACPPTNTLLLKRAKIVGASRTTLVWERMSTCKPEADRPLWRLPCAVDAWVLPVDVFRSRLVFGAFEGGV